MKTLITAVALLVCVATVMAQEEAAVPEVEMSGKIEGWYQHAEGVGRNSGNGRMGFNTLYLAIDAAYEDDYAGRIKLDGADIVNRDDMSVSADAVEEANLTAGNVLGLPVTLVCGKDEMPFGLDDDQHLTDPVIHHLEIDKVLGVIAEVALPEIGSLAGSTYYHRNLIEENQERLGLDNRLGDNVAVQLKLDTLAEGVMAQVSYATEAFADIETTDTNGVTTVGARDDEQRWSVGVMCNIGDLGEVSIEYVGTMNRLGRIGHDPGIVALNLSTEVMDKLEAFGRYERILTDELSNPIAAEDFYLLGLEYSPAENYAVALEYANYSTVDYRYVADLDIGNRSTEGSIKLGVRAIF